jgi:hypothetical protein
VVVNPDRDLARIARDEEWPILNFTRPVRLRDRVPVPPAPALAVTGAVAAAGAGVVVWWMLRRKERERTAA